MAEIQLARIKSLYGDIRGLLSQIPSIKEQDWVQPFVVDNFNKVLDKLTDVSDTNYSDYKVPKTEEHEVAAFRTPIYSADIVRGQLGRVVSRLEQEFGFGNDMENEAPTIVIFNKNQNEFSVQINYTIDDLVNSCDDEEGKDKLRTLRDELDKTTKSWDTIKSVLLWVLNFSKELFIKLIPVILEKYK